MVALKFLGVILAALVFVGCQGSDDRSGAAVEFVSAYVRAASGGDELRGWSYLDDEIKAAMFESDVNVYLAAVRTADWTGLAWELASTDPEDSFVTVRLKLTSGDFPAFLVEPRGSFTLAAGDAGSRSFAVRFGLLGSRTLFALGG